MDGDGDYDGGDGCVPGRRTRDPDPVFPPAPRGASIGARRGARKAPRPPRATSIFAGVAAALQNPAAS